MSNNLLAGVQYKVQFVNNSSNSGNMMIFQQDPDIGVDGVFSLAWFSKYMHPGTRGHFSWTIDYSFMWAETGELIPGVDFLASQVVPADLSMSNKITLTYQDSAYNFANQTSKSPAGSLYIAEDTTIPLKQASVGIGMSGAGTFCVQAQPNTNVTFTPHPEYWIAFGNYAKGQVLDIQEVNNPGNILFPPGVTTMSAILNPDNTWTIEPTTQTVERYNEAVKHNKYALYGA